MNPHGRILEHGSAAVYNNRRRLPGAVGEPYGGAGRLDTLLLSDTALPYLRRHDGIATARLDEYGLSLEPLKFRPPRSSWHSP